MKSSSNICSDVYESFTIENASISAVNESCQVENMTQPVKRIRRRGPYDPQERDRIRLNRFDPIISNIHRRERNRIHAKRTRDKKKHFFENSENMITEMVQEADKLRKYLVSINLMFESDIIEANNRDSQFKRELMKLKVSIYNYSMTSM